MFELKILFLSPLVSDYIHATLHFLSCSISPPLLLFFVFPVVSVSPIPLVLSSAPFMSFFLGPLVL